MNQEYKRAELLLPDVNRSGPTVFRLIMEGLFLIVALFLAQSFSSLGQWSEVLINLCLSVLLGGLAAIVANYTRISLISGAVVCSLCFALSAGLWCLFTATSSLHILFVALFGIIPGLIVGAINKSLL